MTKSDKLKAAWVVRRLTFVPPMKGKRMSEESRLKMSIAAKRRKSNRIGCKHTEETKRRIAEVTRQRTPRGEAHYAFSHGEFQRAMNSRRSPEYKLWRNAVFARDGYACKKCGSDKGGDLRAHHVKPYKTYPELRFEVSNGITLCHDCHELEHFKPDSVRNLRKAKRGHRLF